VLLNMEWLKEYLAGECEAEEIVAALPMIGFDLDRVLRLQEELSYIRVGFVREVSAHPSAAGMFVCQVDLGEGQPRQVVCTDEHPVEVGWGVPVALPGAELPTGVAVTVAEYAGVPSQGMICLDRDMGILPRGSGLQVFPEDVAPGTPLTEVAHISDVLVDIDILSNRPDCLSVIGMAREVAAHFGLELKLPEIRPLGEGEPPPDDVTVIIEDEEACPRYTCRVFRNVRVGRSPAWLSGRLACAGGRPINNVVDVTNFVLYECDHPLHAFDLNRLEERTIIVRRAAPGETIELLDGSHVELDRDVLVIADAKRPVALAGVMGGAATQTDEQTTDVLLECAYFDPVLIRRTAKRLGISTESSYRFERGMDPNEGLERALRRATALIAELAGADVRGGVVDVYPKPIAPRRLRVSAEFVSRYLGCAVTEEQVSDCLRRLGYEREADGTVVVPTRRIDCNDAVVLAEDVARLLGYDNIPLRPPRLSLTRGRRREFDAFRGRVARALSARGFLQANTLPLDAPARLRKWRLAEAGEPLELQNPMSKDMSALRPTLLPRLLEVAQRNQRRGYADLRFFEIDRVVRGEGDDAWAVAGVAAGAVRQGEWEEHRREIDFLWLKGVLESALEELHIDPPAWQRSEVSWLDPSEQAALFVAECPAGIMGRLAPAAAEELELEGSVYLFELDLGVLRDAAKKLVIVKPVPRMPSVERDISIVVDYDIPYAELEATVLASAGEFLEQVRCFDVYAGKGIPPGKRSIGLRMVFRAPDRTLTGEEVARAVEAVIAALEREHGATLRGR